MIRIANTILPKSKIHVMAGDTVGINEESSKIAIIHRRICADEIVELFDNSDLGIFTSSTVCVEAFSRELPVAAGYYVDNQEELYRYGVKNELFSPLGNLRDDSSAISERLREVVENNRPKPISIDFRKQKEKIIQLFKEL